MVCVLIDDNMDHIHCPWLPRSLKQNITQLTMLLLWKQLSRWYGRRLDRAG